MEVGKKFLSHLKLANEDANGDLFRIALKMATGTGKTTVMAMIIAWQTVNAVHSPNSKTFTRAFLIVTPGITIKDRLRVLQPNDSENYYKYRELVPQDMLSAIEKAKIVITNYHSFQLREKIKMSKTGRQLLKGRGEDIKTLETEGEMLRRIVSPLMGFKNILVINDEAHHCYREKQGEVAEDYTGAEKEEVEENKKAARLWFNGLLTVKEKMGVKLVVDLSATPFFLRGSGYAEGTLFPWTMSDFSLMDAIESGIVKLPRVPVVDNVLDADIPKFRNLWQFIGKNMPKKGKNAAGVLDPERLPVELLSAIDALYGHYEKTFAAWKEAGIGIPPVFIVVAQNTSISELIYKYISGYVVTNPDGIQHVQAGRLKLFRNFDEYGNPLSTPNTLLIDSVQLDSGEAIDDAFRNAAADEIERFRRETIERTGNPLDAEKITDEELLREVLNTVGKQGKLGAQIRCVVSVSMLTEGWDANNVTHILGVRAFGTQLLAEQVIGRALRRQSYDLNDEALFNPEYADIFGIPFDFAAEPVIAAPGKPEKKTHVHSLGEEFSHLEITFPRVEGFRKEFPKDTLNAAFNDESTLTLSPELTGPSITQNAAIIGKSEQMDLQHLEKTRSATIVYKLAEFILTRKLRDDDGLIPHHLFGQLRQIVHYWLMNHLVCKGNTYPAMLLYQELADMAAEKIVAAISRSQENEATVHALVEPYNPLGSTAHVNFFTSKVSLWDAVPAHKSHVNYVVLDSSWEGEFCRVVESHPQTFSYAKNHSLGLEVPYRFKGAERKYRPDFIVRLDDGHGPEDLLNLIVEIKGYRGEDAIEKKSTMDSYWIPGVNNLKKYGRWAFAELKEGSQIQDDYEKLVRGFIKK